MSENKHTPEPFGHELKRLAEKVKGWSSCNAAWSIADEDDPEYLTAAVGAIGEDGEEYPVAIVDCDNYFAGSDSLHLANFYAAANPQAVLEIIKQRDELNRLCEFNEKTMQFLLDVINHIVDEAKLTSSQYELCRQAIASVKGEQ